MNRRSLVSTSAIVAPAIALAACAATIGAGTGSSVASGISRVISIAEGILNYVGPVVPLVAAFVPPAAPFVSIVMEGIALANGLLGTLSTTMAAAEAQPVVGKVATSIGGVLDAGDQAVALISNPAQKAQAQGILMAARGELKLLTQLAVNIQAVVSTPAPTAALRPGVVVPPILTISAV